MDNKEQDAPVFYKIIRLHSCLLLCKFHNFVDYQSLRWLSSFELFGFPVSSHCDSFSPDSLFQTSKKPGVGITFSPNASLHEVFHLPSTAVGERTQSFG
jgi:hypothetical protein